MGDMKMSCIDLISDSCPGLGANPRDPPCMCLHLPMWLTVTQVSCIYLQTPWPHGKEMGAERVVGSPKSRAGAMIVEELACGPQDGGCMRGLNKCCGHTPLQSSCWRVNSVGVLFVGPAPHNSSLLWI